jgi:hypothetical protein
VKPANFLRYVLLPAVMLAAGMKLGVKYAQGHYVVKDRKFIEGKVVKDERSQ